jgi:CrcB protein
MQKGDGVRHNCRNRPITPAVIAVRQGITGSPHGEFLFSEPVENDIVEKIIGIAVAGALGSLARYWLGGLVQQHFNGGFPAGTFAVNIVGSFLFGVVWTLAEERMVISAETRTVILVGFMGAFTTFSTFMFETGTLMRDSQWLLAIGNVAAQVIVGLIGLFLGLALGRSL